MKREHQQCHWERFSLDQSHRAIRKLNIETPFKSVRHHKFNYLCFLLGMFCSLSSGCGGEEGQEVEPVLEQIQTVLFEPACATSGAMILDAPTAETWICLPRSSV